MSTIVDHKIKETTGAYMVLSLDKDVATGRNNYVEWIVVTYDNLRPDRIPANSITRQQMLNLHQALLQWLIIGTPPPRSMEHTMPQHRHCHNTTYLNP